MQATAAGASTPSPYELAIGAVPGADGVAFRVWAPVARRVHVVLERTDRRESIELHADGEGFFAAHVSDAHAGELYRFQLDDGPLLPDPASRFQPQGPHGPSQVVDAAAFAWTDAGWSGPVGRSPVTYEMHVGTFTPDGTWEAAIEALPALAELGITIIELMPVAEFAGDFGWGYDGVDLFAPYHRYGTPDDMRRFVDAAHALGLGVILDVVYNHFGPDGNYLSSFTRDWFSERASEWGDAPNFDGPNCAPVRAFYLANAAYWIVDFHLDGLRLDATQQIFDRSDEHVVAAIVRAVHAAAGQRRVYVVAENEPQHARIARPIDARGFGCDAIWNDDFHHAALVALRGRSEAYYSDYAGSAQEIVSALKYGFLFQGQHSAWIDKPRGTPAFDLRPDAFVHYLENHDQVANSLRGERLSTLAAPASLRALTAPLLLAPQTPLIFQGQEYGSTRRFLYFADHAGELGRAVRAGRGKFLAQFPSIADEAAQRSLDDPAARATFAASKLDPRERESAWGQATLALYRDLLALRRDDPVFSGRWFSGLDGSVLDARTFVLRFFANDGDDRLICVNLGGNFARATVAEPLLAPPAACRWRRIWSSEDLRYGGSGDIDRGDGGWRFTAQSASVWKAERLANTERHGDG